MKDRGDDYEGLEAMVINKKWIYFLGEIATHSNNYYLPKGVINDTAIVLDTSDFFAMQKSTTSDGKHIYNEGFEAIAHIKNSIAAFFEYNYFSDYNLVSYIMIGPLKKENVTWLK